MSKPITVKGIPRLPIPWYYKILAPLFNLIGPKQTFRIYLLTLL